MSSLRILNILDFCHRLKYLLASQLSKVCHGKGQGLIMLLFFLDG